MSPPLELGLIGLGRMGANMARRLSRGGATVHAFDVSPAARAALGDESRVTLCDSLSALVQSLPTRRVLWLMLPAGEISEHTLSALLPLLVPGDLIIDGANANYRDSQRRGAMLATHGLEFMDAGVSGGIWGLREGYALMLGGSTAAVASVKPLVQILAPSPERGWLHCGPIGAGHYVKMVHNGIEYGMMQAFAEGLALMQAKSDLQLDLGAISEMWRHGSVVRSWLLDLIAEFLQKDTQLEHIKPVVADSGEGRWTAIESIELGVPTPVMTQALMARFASQGRDDYGAKLLAMMRAGFGGHAVQSRDGQA
ncbi:MAG: decarboxylating 6-phosphogluconate dehydrogenase [Betaproteobacteria bacterium]|nr:decarboxylating 6-phosphogluconate dehydrogenase [Betaproteobacteria bacterium]